MLELLHTYMYNTYVHKSPMHHIYAYLYIYNLMYLCVKQTVISMALFNSKFPGVGCCNNGTCCRL